MARTKKEMGDKGFGFRAVDKPFFSSVLLLAKIAGIIFIIDFPYPLFDLAVFCVFPRLKNLS